MSVKRVTQNKFNRCLSSLFFFSIQFILLKFFYKKYFCSVLGQHFGNSTNIYACIFAASLTTVSLVIQKFLPAQMLESFEFIQGPTMICRSFPM